MTFEAVTVAIMNYLDYGGSKSIWNRDHLKCQYTSTMTTWHRISKDRIFHF